MVPYILQRLLAAAAGISLSDGQSQVLSLVALAVPVGAVHIQGAAMAHRGGFYLWAFGVQATDWVRRNRAASAFAGIRLPGLSTLGLFVLGNSAMAVGAIKALVGHRMPKWEPVR